MRKKVIGRCVCGYSITDDMLIFNKDIKKRVKLRKAKWHTGSMRAVGIGKCRHVLYYSEITDKDILLLLDI